MRGNSIARTGTLGSSAPKFFARSSLQCVAIFWLVWCFASASAQGREGLLIYKKDPDLSDATAKSVIFGRIEIFPYNIKVYAKGDSRPLRLLKNQAVSIVYFNDLVSGSYADERGEKLLRDEFDQLTKAKTQYRVDESAVDERLTNLDVTLKLMDQGKALINGRWVGKEELEKLQPSQVQIAGKVFKSPRVTWFENGLLRFLHEGGVMQARISDLQREQIEILDRTTDRYDLSRFAAAASQSSNNPAGAGVSTAQSGTGKSVTYEAWEPGSAIEAANACLIVYQRSWFDTEEHSVGSAFLCNVNGVSYIYTNIHVINGARTLRFADRNGIQYKDVVSAEVAARPWGLSIRDDGTPRGGGDLVRFRLKEYRPRGLTLADSSIEPKISDQVFVIGNRGGEGEVVVSKGSITKHEEGIFTHNAPSEGGNSGSPVILADSMKVIGIETWGPQEIDPIAAIWQDGILVEEGGGIGYAASLLVRPRYVELSVSDLLRFGRDLEEFKYSIRVLSLLDVLNPTVDGIFTSPSDMVGPDASVQELVSAVLLWYTIRDKFDKAGRHSAPIRHLIQLHEELRKNRESKIRISLADVFKAYHSALRLALTDFKGRKEYLETRPKPYFYDCHYGHFKTFRVAEIYEDVLEEAGAWYKAQISVGAKNVLGDRPRLPTFNSRHWQELLD